jgi:general secretion pathway protein L
VKIVGLNIANGIVAASVIQRDFRKKDLVDSFSQPYASDEELVDILRSRAESWSGATIVSSIPGRFFTQRVVTFPFFDRKRLEKALPFELEDTVPFELDDVIVDHIVLNAGRNGKAEAANEAHVLGIMLPKEVLRKHLDLLASGGIDPKVVVPSYVGLDALSPLISADGCSLLACGSDVCLRKDGAVKALRSLSVSYATAGVRHTVQALEIEQKERVEKACLLSPDPVSAALFAELDIAVEEVVTEFGGKRPADPLSLGLALVEHINFRQHEFAYRREDEGIRRKKRSVLAAAAITAALFIANIGVKYYMIETTYGKLDREIQAIYKQAVPDAKVAADPVRQLRSSLEEARKKYGALAMGTSVLDAMKAITDGVPREIRVSFQEFNMENDRVKLQGDAPSFEAVDKVKAELQKSPLLSDVNVLDTRMGTDNKVKFRLDVKIKQES